MKIGQGFFTPESQDLATRRHLWFIVSNPDIYGKIVIANISTEPCAFSENCVIARGEHDKVTQDSYLRFDHSRVVNGKDLTTLFEKRMLQPTTPASRELIKKIQLAIAQSPVVSREAKEILLAQGVLAKWQP